jgi:uncharacterized NAD-dependent epimerase/dehydratase family protein
MSTLKLRGPYLVFLGDAISQLDAKTGHGVAYWTPEDCVGQLRYANCKADTGLPDMDIRQAVRAGARSLLIGVAPTGGKLKADWESTLASAIEAGLDVISGLHTPLEAVPRLANAAARNGRRLVDVRVPPEDIPVATGRLRSGLRLLTVGTDCAVGKKYTALALHRSLRQKGRQATFRASGQTGIMIAGEGIPIDAVVADFVSGAAELLSPDNHPDHWDLVEGQGSLFHPAYAAVTLGLVHGSQPDAMVLCHQAGRNHLDEYPGYAIPSMGECIRHYEEAARLTNPTARCIGLSINTRHLSDAERMDCLQRYSDEAGLPCVDPIATGVETLIDALPGD